MTWVAGDTFEDLVDHLEHTTSLDQGEASRVVAEVLGYFAEDVVTFIRRRHAELRDQGLKNEEVFATVSAELPWRRFAPSQLSMRQLRRIIYG